MFNTPVPNTEAPHISTLSPSALSFDPTLYVITDSTYNVEESLLEVVEATCRGGASLLQLREKELNYDAYLARARKVKAITDQYHIPLIIDDQVYVAQACGAAGVHVGEHDTSVAACRRILGPDAIIGATAKTIEAAQAAEAAGASYLGTGAIFPTTTHVITRLTPVATLDAICRAVSIPVVAIGGLNADNIHVLQNSPIAGIAVVSAVMRADDPYAVTQELRARYLAMCNSEG